MDGNLYLLRDSHISQIKAAIKTAQATASFHKEALTYPILKEVLKVVGETEGLYQQSINM